MPELQEIMKNTDTDVRLIGRRDVLRGAVMLAGAAAIGWETTSSAEAATVAGAVRTTLAFWNGSSFISPASIQGSASGLAGAGASVLIHGHIVPSGAQGALDLIKAHYAISNGGQLADVPVYVWAASSDSRRRSAFNMPVNTGQGLQFSVTFGPNAGDEDYYYLAVSPPRGQPRLAEGTYAIARGSQNWSACRLMESGGSASIVRQSLSGSSPVTFEYILITIAVA